MVQKKNKVNVEIFGETYALKGDAEPERILRLAALLDERMRQIAKKNPRLSTVKIAVLAALITADEFDRLENDYRQLIQMAKEGK